MAENEPGRGFRLRDLVALIIVLIVLFAIFFPSNVGHQEASRRNQCSNKLKQIGLALQNHHDAYRRFPALTTQGSPDGLANVWNTAPGATFAPDSAPPNGYQQSPARAAGYCWLVKILPYMEELVLYNSISGASVKFTYEAFSTRGSGGPFTITTSGGARPFATVELDQVRCPAANVAAVSTASSGQAGPGISIPPYAALYSASPRRGVVTTNYVALSATHLA